MASENPVIRAGIVSSVQASEGTVRVTFPDRNHYVTAGLPVVSPMGGWARGNSLPAVGENVLCAFAGSGLQAGFCLGTFFTADKSPPGVPSQRGVWFEDGSSVYYDRQSGVLHVKPAGSVKIEGDLIVTGTLTRGGEAL
ncbi:phage baseplate assembly protein V [Paenibacillus chitinolyticus]